MKLQSVTLRWLRMPLREPFVASHGAEYNKEFLLLTVLTKHGAQGHGECTATVMPLYLEETNHTAWHVLADFLIPELLGRELSHPDETRALLARFRGHNMAKAALETAVWGAYANEEGLPLAQALGGIKSEIEVGISIGIQPSVAALLTKIEGYLEQGYRRIKIKLKPGWDVQVVSEIRRVFGDIPLMGDANSAYTLADADVLARLDEFDLLMIEQPLAYDDLVDHAHLQSRLRTPICLDESIRSAADGRKAIELGACRVINIKSGRVGGLSEARDLSEVCARSGVAAWCGGMLESGVGRLSNIALTSLPGFTLPGDTAPSARYFEQDIIDPPVRFVRPGYLAVPSEPGMGAELATHRVEQRTIRKQEFRKP